MSQHNLAQERREIVARYDRGREDNAFVDPWEDPQWEVYHKTDRYGFIHDERLPLINANEKKKMIEKETKRTDKWLIMIQNWDRFMKPGSEKLRKRIYKGIPNKVRSVVWSRLLRISEIKQEQEGVYQKMRELARSYSPEIRQIDLDVNRTYRNHEMFKRRYDVKQQELFHVLAGYSMYNTEVGYCQGMSQVAALLLMYMSEEDAFWALSALLSDRKFAMHGFFIPGFPKLIRFQTLHESILKKNLPKVKKHIDKHDIHTNLYSVKWFFQCFLDRVPFHLCLRLWDIYLFEGERLLIAMSYNVFKMHSRMILKLKSMEGVIDLLQRELEQDFGYPDDEVIEKLTECMDELKKLKLDLPGSIENELPTKPFGLLYHPTVGQVRRFVDSSILGTERTSVASSDDNSRSSNGYPVSPHPVVPDAKLRHVSEERLSRPNSRQMQSVYDNVDRGGATLKTTNNRVRPVDQLPPSPSSPEKNKNLGDSRYVSVVQVTTEGHDRVLGRSGSVIEKSEILSREFSIGGPTRSPGPGLPKVTASQIQSQRDGLKATMNGITRYGVPHESDVTLVKGRSSYLDPPPDPTNGNGEVQPGGPTVIRIGM